MSKYDQLKDQILRLLNEGKSQRDVAKALGLTRTGLQGALDRWDAPVVANAPEPVKENMNPLDSLSNDELIGLVSTVGLEKISSLGAMTPTAARQYLTGRNVPTSVASMDSPRTAGLTQRVKTLERTMAQFDELAKEIHFAAETAIGYMPPLPDIKIIKRSGPAHETPVDVLILASDLQYGEHVDPEEVPGGRYGPEIFRDERLPRWVDGVTDLLATVSSQHPIRTVWILQNGDFVEGDGMIFSGQHHHLALNVGQQIVSLAPLWANAVLAIANTAKTVGADKVAVISTVGNHGVPGGRKGPNAAIPPSGNYDFIVYEMVRSIVMNTPNHGIDFYDEQPRWAIYFEAQGHTCLLTHGDRDRGGNGVAGVPLVSAVKNELQVRVSTGLNHRYTFAGHVHRPTSISLTGDSERFYGGDWCGPNNLSVASGGGAEPMQRCFVLHPTYGNMLTWDIRLAPGTARTAPEVLHLN